MNGIHQDILSNINSRYVLLKREASNYSIVDKLKRVIISIDDPIINVQRLIEAMINLNVEVYTSYDQLPEAIEKPIRISDATKTLKAFIQKVYDERQRETGSIISVITDRLITDDKDKRRIEGILEDYAFTALYPYEGLNIYTSIYTDTVSIIVIKNINNLPSQDINPKEVKIIDR